MIAVIVYTLNPPNLCGVNDEGRGLVKKCTPNSHHKSQLFLHFGIQKKMSNLPENA
jgi:hypothetical protein